MIVMVAPRPAGLPEPTTPEEKRDAALTAGLFAGALGGGYLYANPAVAYGLAQHYGKLKPYQDAGKKVIKMVGEQIMKLMN